MTMQTAQTTASALDYPADDRIDFFRESISTSLAPMDIRAEPSANFIATMRSVDLGALQLSTYKFPSLEVLRTARMIRQSDPDIYMLNLTLRGRGAVRQDRRTCMAQQGDLCFYNLSSPYQLSYAGEPGARDKNTAISVQIPRALLPIPIQKVKRLFASPPFPGQAGIDAVLSQHLRQLAQNADQLRPADATRLGTITLDLIAATLAHHLDTEATLPPETRQQATHACILNFIDRHLADPALTPSTIAAAHHISLRTLHRLFQAQGTTVTDWIRHRRLDRCRRDLTDPAMNTQSIQAIAAHWGFPDNAHFSRTFTATHGLTPSTYRQHPHGVIPLTSIGNPPADAGN
ncbi:helix-turn-helix domain-containing protein [Plantactinospora sp. CA-290183]|uniref:AraC-like ligand-binding domain-containing protein n=1 Tax=Plantactinospora sp. CA-290183 TaxID=3240006 RepID=UPI003D942DB3